MHTSHFGKSLNYHLTLYAYTQTELSKRAGVDQSAISNLISKAKRPEVNTLKAMCTCWPDASANLRVLIEHLRDEMLRAGHDPMTEIEFRAISPGSDRLDLALSKLATLVHLDPDVAALTLDLVALATRAYQAEGEMLAADPPEDYACATPAPKPPRRPKKA